MIAQSMGFFVESTTRRTALCAYKADAHDKEIYFLKEDRRNLIYDSKVSVKEINGYSISLNSCVKFTDNLTDANKIAIKLEKKAIQNKREKERNLAHVIGSRLKYARETLCGISQLKAAESLGITNIMLSHFERGLEGRKPTHDVIIKSAKLYKISTDYIYGITDEWETDINDVQERHIQSWVLSELESYEVQRLNITRKIGNRIAVVSNAAKLAIEYAKEIEDAINTIIKLNPAYDECFDEDGSSTYRAPSFENDIKGGNTLIKKVNHYRSIIDGVKASLERVSEYKKVASKSIGINFDVFEC